MRVKIKDVSSKVKTCLTDNEYQTAKQLGEKCRLKPTAIHRVIRFLRISGIGVLTTNKGYVLSQFAKKTDDVNFIRRLYGRRTSDYLALKAAEPDISHRWRSIEDSRQLKLLISPLNVDLSNSQGMKVLLSKTSKGI